MNVSLRSGLVVLALCACRTAPQSPAPQSVGDAGVADLPSRVAPAALQELGVRPLQGLGLRSAVPQQLEEACPADERGAHCALVSDERALLEAELAVVERGETLGERGLCHPTTGFLRPQPKIDVELSSPEGSADVGLTPAPQRVMVSGVTTLKREEVFGACALLDGRPALVEVNPARDGRQTVTVRRRASTPLSVVVKTRARIPVTGFLHVIPTLDWGDIEAGSVPLSFVGDTAEAPERVPGVWSVASVKVGQLVAARLVRPDESQIVLTPGPPATMRVQVKAPATPVPLVSAWFGEVMPGSPMECLSLETWGRWGEVHFDGATTAVIEVPPGARRCVFLQTSLGDVVAVRAPTTSGMTTRELTIPAPPIFQ